MQSQLKPEFGRPKLTYVAVMVAAAWHFTPVSMSSSIDNKFPDFVSQISERVSKNFLVRTD